nr:MULTISPECIES: hypothetical protein [unclassified Sphingomonas]
MIDDARQIGILEEHAQRIPVLATLEAACLRLVWTIIAHPAAR